MDEWVNERWIKESNLFYITVWLLVPISFMYPPTKLAIIVWAPICANLCARPKTGSRMIPKWAAHCSQLQVSGLRQKLGIIYLSAHSSFKFPPVPEAEAVKTKSPEVTLVILALPLAQHSQPLKAHNYTIISLGPPVIPKRLGEGRTGSSVYWGR